MSVSRNELLSSWRSATSAFASVPITCCCAVEIDQMDVIDILNDDGSLKPIREWPKIWRTTLSGFDLSSTIMNMDETSIETILKKIKWPDKVKTSS